MVKEKKLLKNLSPERIDSSVEIQEWLSQFSDSQVPLAKLLLNRLRFVSRDDYAQWLEQEISLLIVDESSFYALYSVRKLGDQENDNLQGYWTEAGEPVTRPGSSLGSEDLVYSLISNLSRSNNQLLDHPSLVILKQRVVRNYILIDDSIGSGDRVSTFINSMLNNPTFLSWWSFGWIKIHIISFARMRNSEKNIIEAIRGSDHAKRKFKKSSKITFTSEIVYQQNWFRQRWGENYLQLMNLCKEQKGIASWARLGYGNVFSNIIFYHSVPNNTPGVLWFGSNKWKALMPNRALPKWLVTLLDSKEIQPFITSNSEINKELLNFLALIKRGVRKTRSLALRLSIDSRYADDLLQYAITMGLVTSDIRLTQRGLDIFYESSRNIDLPVWDYRMYIPSSWCANQETIQPSKPVDYNSQVMAEFIEPSCSIEELLSSINGDIGEISLEKSDVKAVAPPFTIKSQCPTRSWEGLDTDGPLWGPQKEK